MRARLVWVAVLAAGMAGIGHCADDSGVARLRKDLEYLTSDECEGRGAATKGIFKAADYIAAEFKRLGLKPGGVNGGYFQPFRMQAGKAAPGADNRIALRGPLGQEVELRYNDQFRPLGFSVDKKFAGPLVFVGYGIAHKESGYDDYQGLDVAGKVVVMMRKAPTMDKNGKPFGGSPQAQNALGSLTTKLLTAAEKKAVAVLFVNDADTASKEDTLAPFDYTSFQAPPVTIPSLQLKRTVVDSMLVSSSGRGLKEIERDILRTVSPQSVDLKGWSVSGESSVIRRQADVPNVIGIREGKGPLAGEYVIVGAHFDHLGRGEQGSTENDPKKRENVHRGADDNGSGTVSVLELARRVAQDGSYEGRTVVFMTFAGEEQGLLGSQHFCKNPTVPLDKVAAMLNLDMVGRLRADTGKTKGKLEVGGVGSAKEFPTLLDELNKKYDFELNKTVSAFGPSDHTSFAEKKIPVFFFFTGLHKEYHKPADTIDTINFDGMSKIVAFGHELLGRLVKMEKPAYVQTQRASGGFRGNVPRIGIMPGNYGDADKGVLVGGVSEGGAAAKAGLKEGDVILEIAGKPVKNMTAYMAVMGLQKKGDAIPFVIERAGKKLTLTVKPE